MSTMKRLSTKFSYSAAVEAGDFIFIGLHRGSGDTFGVQLQHALEGLRKTLGEFRLTLEDLTKVNVWLKNINDLPEMEKIFFNYFEKDGFPARMTATTEFIDTDCLVMIEGTAYRMKD